jgi:hypothetical protein
VRSRAFQPIADDPGSGGDRHSKDDDTEGFGGSRRAECEAADRDAADEEDPTKFHVSIVTLEARPGYDRTGAKVGKHDDLFATECCEIWRDFTIAQFRTAPYDSLGVRRIDERGGRMRSQRVGLVLCWMLGMLVLAPGLAEAAPVPTTITSLSFPDTDCSHAFVAFTWSGVRTASVTVAVNDAAGTRVASDTFVLAKPSRRGTHSFNFPAPATAPYNGSWAGQSIRGFGEAFSVKGPGYIGLSDLRTCVAN